MVHYLTFFGFQILDISNYVLKLQTTNYKNITVNFVYSCFFNFFNLILGQLRLCILELKGVYLQVPLHERPSFRSLQPAEQLQAKDPLVFVQLCSQVELRPHSSMSVEQYVPVQPDLHKQCPVTGLQETVLVLSH